MAVASNADDYANGRINIFFPGITPDLDGQCVSLVKGFMQDMSSVPNPQAARGDARYVGKNLVAEGLAKEVPYSERRRGDIVCYEYGTYGHIAVQLSGGRVFEENVNWSGVASKVVDGAVVYASRIGSENESWRHDQHVYRLNSYSEGGVMDIFNEGDRQNYLAEHGIQDVGQYKDLVDQKVSFKVGVEKMRTDGAWHTNDGDVINLLTPMLGHAPSADDLFFWSNKVFKNFTYEKIMPGVNDMRAQINSLTAQLADSGKGYVEVPGPVFTKSSVK